MRYELNLLAVKLKFRSERIYCKEESFGFLTAQILKHQYTFIKNQVANYASVCLPCENIRNTICKRDAIDISDKDIKKNRIGSFF